MQDPDAQPAAPYKDKEGDNLWELRYLGMRVFVKSTGLNTRRNIYLGIQKTYGSSSGFVRLSVWGFEFRVLV